MAELKTKQTEASVSDFLNSIEDEQKRKDCKKISKMMQEISGKKPKMWGDSIVGFGKTTYKYASGREGEWMEIAFAPRSSNITLYILPGLDLYPDLLEKLGKHKIGKSCLYIRKLDDLDEAVLRKLIKNAVKYMRSKKHGHGQD